jgi:hypothetical protein
MAGNLGFVTYVVSDATAFFARAAVGGSLRPAEAVHSAAVDDVHEEFATVIDTGELLKLAEASIPSEMPNSTRVVAIAPAGYGR